MKKRVRIGILLCMLALFALTACGSDKNTENKNSETQRGEVQDTTAENQDTQDQAEDTASANMNLLTGLNTLTDEAIGKRPVAIMINNIPKAMPQYGIAAADVVFEVTVEGGLSRMMALYGDYTQVPKVCSVRSCRKYFPEIAEGFDAVYVCSGMSSDVKAYINTLGLTLYEGDQATGGLFGRDQDRRKAGYSLEHTMYFDGTGLAAAMASRNERTDIDADKTGPAFKFADQTVVPNGGACKSVTIDFGALTSTLQYDEATNTYLKQLNGKAQVDGVAGTQLAFTNVIVLETKVGQDVNGKDRTIDWTGGKDATAYYISNGAVQQIYWEKDSIESRIVFYDMNGNELAINTGKTYIAINFTGRTTIE